jgi:hypothetical protein
MIERLQFWGVLVWTLGLLALGAFAVRKVWGDVTARRPPPGPDTATPPSAERTNPPDP